MIISSKGHFKMTQIMEKTNTGSHGHGIFHRLGIGGRVFLRTEVMPSIKWLAMRIVENVLMLLFICGLMDVVIALYQPNPLDSGIALAFAAICSSIITVVMVKHILQLEKQKSNC